LKHYNIDIIQKEGLWFGNLENFAQFGIKVKRVIQNAGEAVIYLNYNYKFNVTSILDSFGTRLYTLSEIIGKCSLNCLEFL